MTTSPVQAAAAAGPSNQRSAWSWALRRALVGLTILTVVVAGAAWLLYAAIDPDQEGASLDAITATTQLNLEKNLPGPDTPAKAAQ